MISVIAFLRTGRGAPVVNQENSAAAIHPARCPAPTWKPQAVRSRSSLSTAAVSSRALRAPAACRAAACLCMARLTLWLGQKLGNLLAALFVSAVGYCLPALLALSGMSNGIEWLGFYPLFHAAALCQTQGTNAAGAPYNLLWVPIFLAVVAAALAWAIGNDLTEAYEWAGVDLDAL